MKYLIGFIIFFYSNLFSGNIENLQKKFEEIKSFQANFIETANNANSLKGKFYFSQKNNYRIDLLNNTIISNGISIWNIDHKRKKVVISNIEEDPLAFSLRDYIYEYPKKCEISEEFDEDGNSIILMKAKNEKLNFKSAKLWFNSDYLITKIRVNDPNNNQFIFIFDDIKIDNVDESIFNINDFKDLKVIDLR